MSKVTISKSRPAFRRTLRTGPGHPFGERILVREFAPESQAEGSAIALPEDAKARCMAGVIVAVGDQAADKLRDLGAEIGDEVWYAKYAGVIQEWHHIVGKDNEACPHDSAWDFVPGTDKRWAALGVPDDNRRLRSCRSCETLRLTERVIVMAVEDIHVNVDVLERIECGELVRRRGEVRQPGDEPGTGQTRYYIERREKRPDTFETTTGGKQ